MIYRGDDVQVKDFFSSTSNERSKRGGGGAGASGSMRDDLAMRNSAQDALPEPQPEGERDEKAIANPASTAGRRTTESKVNLQGIESTLKVTEGDAAGTVHSVEMSPMVARSRQQEDGSNKV